MTTLELQLLLDELVEMSFLDSILEISKQEKGYKKSEFFRTTGIPLIVLYEKYLQSVFFKTDKVEEIALAIENMNISRFTEKLSELIDKALDQDNLKERIEGFQKGFDIEELVKQNSELEEAINKLK